MPGKKPKSRKSTRIRHVPKRFKELDVTKNAINSRRPLLANSLFSNKKTTITATDLKDMGIQNFAAKNYIPSDLDKPELIMVKQVALIGGQGLYARQDIPKGTCIGIYTGKVYPLETFEKSGADNSYAMTVGNSVVDAIEKGNFTRYVNFSDTQANVEFVEGRKDYKLIVKVITTEDIKAGMQILIDYNTFDEKAAGHYVFLNPTDDERSYHNVLMQHPKQYKPEEVDTQSKPLNLAKGDPIVMTHVGEIIYYGDNLSTDLAAGFDLAEVNLPFFKLDSSGEAAESFSPLMMACYLGQLENVKWLVEHGANINQQHNKTGHSPVFYALSGYAEAKNKSNLREVILYLLENHANLATYDESNSTFLHEAIKVLSDEDFYSVIDLLNKQDPEFFSSLFEYLDTLDDDIIVSCIRAKEFAKLQYLLELYPDYFQKNYSGQNQDQCTHFLDVIDKLSDKEKDHLKELMLELNDPAGSGLLQQDVAVENRAARASKK
ncbi:MAG: SET domain-containing protein-lysine N-methyltransferase [Legionella sp.]|nr:MAG: SET domain-containing protein-lysine N-methyltransferase [Legionella sp.]